MAVSFHKRPGRGRSSAGQVRRYQPAGQDAAQVRPHGHRSGQPHRRVAAPTPGGGRGTAGCGHPALRKHHWWCPATSGNPSVTAAPCQLLLRCPKFFARICSQNFDHCHSFLLASSATGGARKRPPLHKGAFRTGGCGLPRRFAPRNDSPKPLSFRGGPTGRRGNPSFFTMDGGAGRRT